MQKTNGALFLKGNFLSYTSLSGFVTVKVHLTTIYASLKSHRNVYVLNHICLLGLHLSSALLD